MAAEVLTCCWSRAVPVVVVERALVGPVVSYCGPVMKQHTPRRRVVKSDRRVC